MGPYRATGGFEVASSPDLPASASLPVPNEAGRSGDEARFEEHKLYDFRGLTLTVTVMLARFYCVHAYMHARLMNPKTYVI